VLQRSEPAGLGARGPQPEQVAGVLAVDRDRDDVAAGHVGGSVAWPAEQVTAVIGDPGDAGQQRQAGRRTEIKLETGHMLKPAEQRGQVGQRRAVPQRIENGNLPDELAR
jgi:hypothetical protein